MRWRDMGLFWKDAKSLAEFADYSDDADLAKSARSGESSLNRPCFLQVMIRHFLTMLAMGVLAMATGCHAIDFYTPSLQRPVPPEMEAPRELSMVSLPAYRIAPPDVLQILVVKLVPRDSYRIGPYDVLTIHVFGTLKGHPIDRSFNVEADGTINLQAPYGVLRVEGLTIEGAEAELTRVLRFILKEPVVSIKLEHSATVDQLNDVYPVQPDGTINLRNCGMVNVAGKTVTEARVAVQTQLVQYFDSPQVGVEVVQFNSKSYYVVCESMLANGTVFRFPVTGNETVLDAIARLETRSSMSSKTIWVARPAPGDFGRDQILPVDWDAIAHGAITDTNYQILPGDRIYVVEDRLVAMNYVLGKLASPIERLLSIGYLGISTARDTETLGREYNSHRVGE
jgi:polysaccharide biosynthesis/export protein